MSTPAAIDRQIAEQAAQWFLHLQSAAATEQDRQDCAAWRQAHHDHERAWALAQRFSEQLQAIPPTLGRTALQRPGTLNRRNALKALTSLMVLGSLGIAASRTPALNNLTADLRTGVGERRQITLSDGTEIHLNTDSAIDVDYSASQRRITLRRGEVFIVTAADSSGHNRPFMVESGRGQYQPLGTRFSIRQFEGHDQLSVVQGAVAVTPSEATKDRLVVGAGEQARVLKRTASLMSAGAQPADWIDGVLRVKGMRLADFADELNRYRHGWIRCQPAVADVLVSGVFQLQDTDQALAALSLAFPVRARYVTRYWVTLGPA